MKEFMNQKQVYFNANHRTITTDNCNLSTVVECCEKLVKADRLPNLHCGGSIESTISNNGYRTRQTCGIFLSQIHLSKGVGIFTTPSKAVFVARSIRRNKAEFIRTNKASRLLAVVEALSRPLGYGNSHLLIANKRLSQMLFKFLLLGEKRLTVRIRAKSETEARQRIQFTSPAICIARFSDNLTACSANSLHKTVNSLHETGKPCTKDAMFKAEDCMNSHSFLYKFTQIAQNIREKSYKTYDTEQKTILHPFAKIGYSADVVAKSTASRRKLNNLSMANDSTPLTRAFFVRSLRTPKINLAIDLFSMVERIGQRLGVGCEPLIAVSYPDTLYRQAVGSKAVDIKNLSMELSQMFYKFLFTGSRLRITVYARTLAEAYKRLPLSQTKPVLIARLPVQGGIYA